jgi:3-methyladenine DNA glycosylase Tag
VDQKWENFETLFWGFDVDKLLMMPDEMLERKAQDASIVRNLRKVKTIRNNAAMIAEVERSEGLSFGEFIASWPSDNIVGLWTYLKKHGDRLGGNTGPYALRALGVDTFLLTRDVERFLCNHGIVDTGITSRKALESSQTFFNELSEQSGRSLSELSRLVAMCHGDNRLGVTATST